jgi:hypothetical protein
MLELTGHMIIWGGLFEHGYGSNGLMKVVFCYANGRLRVEREHCHGIFGLSVYYQERTSSTYSQRKNNPRQLHPFTQKQLCPKCGGHQAKNTVTMFSLHA